MHRKLPEKVELDDLISAGNFGLMGAINTYNPDREIKFETYGPSRIKGSILDDLREKDWLPRLVHQRANQLAKARQLGCRFDLPEFMLTIYRIVVTKHCLVLSEIQS